MTELVKELLQLHADRYGSPDIGSTEIAAADEIERLTAEIQNLRESCTDLEATKSRLFAEVSRYRSTLQLIERDLGAEVAARHWAHDTLGKHAVESAPWKDTPSGSPTPPVYGFCPICGARGVSRERRPNGNDKCETGHTYASAKAVPADSSQQNHNCEATGHVWQTHVLGDKSVTCCMFCDEPKPDDSSPKRQWADYAHNSECPAFRDPNDECVCWRPKNADDSRQLHE